MVRFYRLTAVLVAAAALGLGACGGDDNEGEEGGSGNVANKSSAEMELDDNYFQPKDVNGSPGQKLQLELKNEGKSEHNLSIDSQKVDTDVEPGQNTKATVTIPKSGSVTFYCKYHRSAGMTGTLAAGGSSSSSSGSSGGGGGGY